MTSSFDQFLQDAQAKRPVEVTDLVAAASSMAHGALQKAAHGEDGFAYAVSLTVVPGEQQGAFVPVLVVVLTGASPIVGERLFVNLLSFNLHPDQDGMDQMVAQGVDQMRVQRSQVVQTTSESGLILPTA